MKNKRVSSFLVYAPYWIGVLAGLYLTVVAAWADLEAAFYGFSRLANSGLRGFSCPVLMTRGEVNSISLKVTNPLDVPLRPVIRVEISTSLLAEEFLETLELAPGETKRLEWAVGPENIDLERFIFAKALVYSVYPLPSQEATCGIFVVDLPGNGTTVLAFLVLLTFGGLGWGVYGMRRMSASDAWEKRHSRPLVFLAVVIGLGVVVSATGGWVPSILLLAVAVLMLVILAGLFVMWEQRE